MGLNLNLIRLLAIGMAYQRFFIFGLSGPFLEQSVSTKFLVKLKGPFGQKVIDNLAKI